MKIIKTLVAIGLLLSVVYVFFLMVSFIQIANEKALCRITPLDQLDFRDYQFCLQEGLK